MKLRGLSLYVKLTKYIPRASGNQLHHSKWFVSETFTALLGTEPCALFSVKVLTIPLKISQTIRAGGL